MNPFSPSVSSMTGIARPKTHRGGRRGKPKGPIGSPQTHVENIQKALTAGDVTGAKPHAFALVRALHAAAPPAPKAQASADTEDTEPGGASFGGPAPKLAASSEPVDAKRARLAKLLKGAKK